MNSQMTLRVVVVSAKISHAVSTVAYRMTSVNDSSLFYDRHPARCGSLRVQLIFKINTFCFSSFFSTYLRWRTLRSIHNLSKCNVQQVVYAIPTLLQYSVVVQPKYISNILPVFTFPLNYCVKSAKWIFYQNNTVL